MHYVIERIARSIIRGEFRDDEPSWGFIFNNAMTERRGEHVVQTPADRARATGGRAACPCKVGELEGSKCASSDMVA